MNKNNEVLCLIIKLILSVVIAFVFSVKYKSSLLSFFSESIYYQVLVITTIVSGYVSIPISYFIYNAYVSTRRKLSKEYNADYLLRKVRTLTQENPEGISDKHKKMLEKMKAFNFKAEIEIELINDEINSLKGTKSNR